MSVVVQETSGSRKSENSSNTIIKTEGEKDRAPSNKRANKPHFSRGGSFRNKHRVKLLQEIEAMAGYGKSKSDSRFWRIRHFGHYDIQSVSVDRIEYQTSKGDSHERLKKHTGASAAQVVVNGDEPNLKEETSNSLVAPCPSFTNEVGSSWLPKDSPLLKLRDILSQEKKMRIYSREWAVMDGDFDNNNCTETSQVFTVQSGMTYPLEYIDHGACYFRNHFYGKEHFNFVGNEEGIGPIVVSLRREKVPESYQQLFSHNQPTNERVTSKYQYRIIVRTSEIPTLRGTILEETIPSSSKTSSNRGVPPREVIEYVTQGEIPISSLKLAKQDDKVNREIMRVDEQALSNRYKIGVLYCKAGQTSEEDWYNNEHGSPAFEEFLELIGMKVKMRGFSKYRAQLDNKTDTTGEYSVYTEYEQAEIMFHVSTLLPFTENNKQQLLRKRHIGNDIVTLIFQEPGSEPFSPKTIRSHFQHIFIIVRVTNPNSPLTEYKVAVSRSSDVPYFGPSIPESSTFQKSEKFRNFMLTKIVNACNSALHSDKLYAMASRTRKQYLLDIVKDHALSVSLEQVGGGALGRLFGRKREKFGLVAPLMFTPGAMTWNVYLITRHWKPLPFSEEHDFSIECILALAPDALVLVDTDKVAILHIPTKDICGYSLEKNRLNLFYDNVYCLSLEFQETTEEDISDFCKRLMAVTPAQEAILLEFSRSVISGLLGFTIDQDGAVVKVDGLAKMRGLQKGARVLQVEDKLICSHNHQAIVSLLHNKHQTILRAYVIPPVQWIDRPVTSKASIDWEKVLSLRPQMPSEMTQDTNEEKSRSERGSPSASEISDADVQSQKCHSDIVSNGHISHKGGRGRRYNRPNQLTVVNPYEDDENMYDRLMSYDRSPGSYLNPPGSPSNRSTNSSMGPASPGSTTGKPYSRVKVPSHKKIARQSVIPIKVDQRPIDYDSVEDERFSWTPVPVQHQIDDKSPYVNTRISQSTPVPDRSHVASPLSQMRKPVTPGALGERNPENLPHYGTVHQMTKRFSEYHRSPVSRTNSRKTTHVPVLVRQDQRPSLSNGRSPQRLMKRPQSCELLYNSDNVPVIDNSRGDSLPPMSDDDNGPNDLIFRRSSNVRLPFRNKVCTNLSMSENEYEFDRRTCLTEEDNYSEITPIPSQPLPHLYSQSSGDESLVAATKVLEELEKYMSEEDFPIQEENEIKSQEKINKLSVRARTHLWEMKAQTQTLPRSFKNKTKSQPCSPLKVAPGAPSTPNSRKHSTFTFVTTSNDEEVTELGRDDSDITSFSRYEDDPSAIISRTTTNDNLSHHTLPLPGRKAKKPLQVSVSASNVQIKNNTTTHNTTTPLNNPLLIENSQTTSTLSKTADQCNYDRNSKDFDQLTWDVVMGDISNYCRNVAEWVMQTESAGVLETPPQRPDSPVFSETCSFTTNSFQSETSDKLKDKVERLESKLDLESESNMELRHHLKKMENQINELQKRQSVRTQV